MKRVEGDAEGQDERRHLHGPGADEGQGGARIAREEGGVLVEHEEAQVERDRHREHGLGARPSADAVEPEPDPEVGGDRREHDHDEAGLAPAVEDEAHPEEPEIAQPAAGDEVPREDYGQEEEEEDRRAEDHMTSLEGRPAWCQFSWYWANLLRHTSFSVGGSPQRTNKYASGCRLLRASSGSQLDPVRAPDPRIIGRRARGRGRSAPSSRPPSA